MKALQEKLDFLLEKYSVGTKALLQNEKTVLIEGKPYPIEPYRMERRFLELKNIVCGGALQGISVMRSFRMVEKGSDIYGELCRELGIASFVLQRRLESITVMENRDVINAIAKTGDGIVCTLEISATLPKGEEPKDKHEIISQRGIACDVVVDAQIRQDSIYVFGGDREKFTDVDFELYGLSADKISIVRAAFDLAKGRNFDKAKENEAYLSALLSAAKRSAESGEREVVE